IDMLVSRGTKTSSQRPCRASVMGSVRRPSPRPTAKGEMRREQTFAPPGYGFPVRPEPDFHVEDWPYLSGKTIDQTGKVLAKLGDFDGIDKNGVPQGLPFPASPAFSLDGRSLYVTNLALDLRLAVSPDVQA